MSAARSGGISAWDGAASGSVWEESGSDWEASGFSGAEPSSGRGRLHAPSPTASAATTPVTSTAGQRERRSW